MADKAKYSFFDHPETDEHYIAPSRFKIETHGKQATTLIDEYNAHPEEFVRTFTVVINGKRRSMVTYQPNENGAKLRNLQRLFVCVLRGLHKQSEHSYAYKVNSSTKGCLKRHMTNDHFLKTDIHAYFDSISFELLKEKVFALSPVMRREHVYWTKVLSACFYDGKMPIGFVSSPMLSDIFLKDVDERFGGMEGISYTRYADDFIISAAGDSAQDRLQIVLDELTDEIAARNLELNKKKTYFRHLRQEGDAIHVLGLNLVRTAENTNRITVSDRFIRETSMELCRLMQEKNQLNDWEARKRFCAVMGKVGYITYASEKSARKLQKMLQVKTGREIMLDYKSLQQACMNNPAANIEYQRIQYVNAWAKATHYNPLPNEGLVWERASVRAATERESQAISSKEWDKEYVRNQFANLLGREVKPMVDILTAEERRQSGQRAYELGSLKYYIMSLCRAAESNLQIRNVRLTIGDETVVVTSSAEVQALREHARKLRGTHEAVSFFAHYQYANPVDGKRHKWGNVYICDGSFRPLLGMAGSVSCTLDFCAVYDSRGKYWKVIDSNGRKNEQALEKSSPSVLMKHEQWQGNIQLNVSWQLAADEPMQVQIRSLLAQLPFGVDEENNCRTVLCDETLHLTADQAISMVDTLRELNTLIKQTEGEMQLDCTLYPAGTLETPKERPLDFVDISTGKSGRVSLKTGTF